MPIKTLKKPAAAEYHPKLKLAFSQFEKLLEELRKRTLPEWIELFINERVDQLNELDGPERPIRKRYSKAQSEIVRKIEKELKLVPKNYYRNLWMAAGLATFGIPFGMAIGIALGNFALLGIGFPFGIAIGAGVGAGMDKKAAEEGRQLDLEIK